MNAISIIVPAYNCEAYISACLESLLRMEQLQGVECEVVVVDDGSTDSTGAVCDDFAARDGRVKVHHIKNGGVSNARNFALAHSGGDWVMFVDGDDVLRRDTLCVLADHGCFSHDITRFGAYEFTERWQRTFAKAFAASKEDYLQLVVHRKAMLGVWGALYRRTLFKENDISFPVDIRAGEDWLVLFKLLLHAKTFSYINEDLYGYRINEQSVTHRLPDSVWNDAARAFNAILSYAKENGMTITDRDIAIARSELRRNMMKLAIIKKQWQYYEDTDREMARYLPQSFWKDIAYSTRLKHKVGFIAYHVLDWYYNTFK